MNLGVMHQWIILIQKNILVEYKIIKIMLFDTTE